MAQQRRERVGGPQEEGAAGEQAGEDSVRAEALLGARVRPPAVAQQRLRAVRAGAEAAQLRLPEPRELPRWRREQELGERDVLQQPPRDGAQRQHQGRAACPQRQPRLWAKDCTPEINTSEIIVDFQLHFPMDFHFCDFWCAIFCPECRGSRRADEAAGRGAGRLGRGHVDGPVVEEPPQRRRAEEAHVGGPRELHRERPQKCTSKGV